MKQGVRPSKHDRTCSNLLRKGVDDRKTTKPSASELFSTKFDQFARTGEGKVKTC